MRLLHELRRRKMFRLTGLYVVGAWLVIQVADIAFPTWGIPESAMRYLFYAAVLCFPIALVFGWIFDIRSDGIIRTRNSGPDEIVDSRMRWQDYVVLLALAAIGVSILLSSVEQIRVETTQAPMSTALPVARHENSVAVLPFENLDPNPETGYFSDGVADEILSRLGNIRELFVVGRASSYAFRNSEEHPASIAAKLGVQYLLSGTVRRDGDLVRVTARLLDESGAHIWSQSFDRELEKTFAIQSEIANEVASRIATEVSLPELQSSVKGTDNADAYSDYLLGKKLFLDRPPRWSEDALDLFRSATELDPDFAPPYAYLAIIHGIYGAAGEELSEFEAATQTALELDSSLAEAWVAQGLLRRHRDDDTESSIDALRRAIEIDPTLSVAYNLLAYALGDLGRITEAHKLRLEALERDPLNPVLMVNVARRFADRGDFTKGERMMLRTMQLSQPPQFAYYHLRRLYLRSGRIDEYLKWSRMVVRMYFDNFEEYDLHRLVEYFSNLASGYMTLGMQDHAEYWMTQALTLYPDNPYKRFWQTKFCAWQHDLDCVRLMLQDIENSRVDRADLSDQEFWGAVGEWQVLVGEYNKSVASLSRVFDLNALEESEADPPYLMRYFAFACEQSGQPEKATQILDAISPGIEAKFEAHGFRVGAFLTTLALNRWQRGERDGAIEVMKMSIDSGWIDTHGVKHDPVARELLAAPEIQEDLARVEREIQRQRRNIEGSNAESEFREEVRAALATIPRNIEGD